MDNRTGVDEVTSMIYVEGLESTGNQTIKEYSWLRAYYNISVTMKLMGLINEELEYSMDAVAVDYYRRMRV